MSTTMVLAIVDEARLKNYACGVIGVRGAPDRALSADVQHRGQLVQIRPAESALAVREILHDRQDDAWLVIVTDRDDDDLGAGILAHLLWQRLRSPDPWEAVRHRFAASGIDPALTQVTDSRELATGLLSAAPPSGWPAAPAGILTRGHALASVAAAHLDLERDGIDALSVLRWTMRPSSVASVGTLRALAGNRLADETLRWLASQAGGAQECVDALLRQGEISDVVPIGVVSSLLLSADLAGADLTHQAQLALVRLEPRWGGERPPTRAIQALGTASAALLADLVHDRRWTESVDRVLRRADDVVVQIQADGLAGFSDLLPRGLRRRVHRLAEALQRVPAADATSPVWADVESAWSRVQAHALSASSARELAPFLAAVRLTRWLATGPRTSTNLADAVRMHMSEGAWVDTAVNDALAGADDDGLASGLAAVAGAVQARRRAAERSFAQHLAAATPTLESIGQISPADGSSPVWTIESLLPDVVMPMAKKAPVLLLVMDGMSAATATEIIDDAIERHGWFEAALPTSASDARASAVAALPTLTSVSRASLLAGRLTTGEQGAERRDYAALTHSVGKIRAVLFHKKDVDTLVPGWAIGDEVGRAISDRDMQLVTVVLNTIDDALDRSDPAGTTWTADAVKHLEPLLARARAAGRTVVMTADHGHIVERRAGTQRSYPGADSGRSRAASGAVEAGEIEVSGPRVLTADHRAVLAVDDTLRYGPLKAGYHGGASAAEVVVPVIALIADPESYPHSLRLLPPQAPVWWLTGAAAAPTVAAASTRDTATLSVLAAASSKGPTLFDDLAAAESPVDVSDAETLGRQVVGSTVYAAQRSVTGRLIVTDDQVANLVDTLVAGSGRITEVLAATALGLNAVRLRGALAQMQQLLNVDGYAVLGTDATSRAVTLDAKLLKEQFEIR
ncbi:MAG TPA: BREX-2 system phosphatase PglZ [Propioniciclava tarda]|nr:BREX-2 system phosphatase PglZ [Propioniciclava tarda]